MSLPDDVAAYLAGHPNSSAVVTEAVRARMARGDAVAAALREVGMNLTDEGRTWARSVLSGPRSDPAESRRHLEALDAGHRPDPV